MSTSTGHETPPPPPPPPHGTREGRDHLRDLPRLRRSNADRRIAGVAGGLARHLDVDPLLVRVAFVVLTLFGGGGLLLYGAAWLVVPEDDTGEAVVRTDDGVRTIVLAVAGGMALLSLVGDTLGGPDVPWPVLVIGLALLVIFARRERRNAPQPWPAPGTPVPPVTPVAAVGEDIPGPTATPPPAADPVFAPYQPPAPRDPRRRGPLLFWFTLALSALLVGVLGTIDTAGADIPSAAYAATVLATTGLMLVVGAFYGRAGGLILVGLLAAGATATAAAVDDGDTGRREFIVDRAVDLRPDYRIGAGELVVDLADITDPAALDGRTLRVDGNVGHLLVVVPDDGLRVEVRSAVDLGESRIFERTSDSGPATGTYGSTTDPTLTVAADLTVGQVTVRTEGERR